MTVSDAAALAILRAAIRDQITDPGDPYHWLFHYDPDTGVHHNCECEEP